MWMHSRITTHFSLLWTVVLGLWFSGCSSTYYATMEKVGYEKRDIMTSRVESARDAQQDAQQEFKSALEQLSELVGFQGGDLERVYDDVKRSYENSADSAETVSKRIDAVESVANDLFVEWQEEINQYNSQRLRQESEQKLRLTQSQYQKLMQSMRRAEAKMTPVLAALKDNMLYLKHNLNARAIGALEGEFQSIKQDIDTLLLEMNRAIQASDTFIAQLQA